MDNISFQSRIRLTDKTEYLKYVTREFTSVEYPWTVKQTALAQKARTDGIFDCTALGITDGEKVLLFHICPTNPKNKDFKQIKNQIIQKIKDLMNPEYLQGLILGSKQYNIGSPKSSELFNIIENLFKELHIQYSKFKGGDFTNNLAYNSTKDEWIIGSEFLDILNSSKETVFKNPDKVAAKIFDHVSIANCDELTW